jgi:hypothetical protein
MYVKTFKTDVIFFMEKVVLCLTDYFQFQSQFLDTEKI